MEDLEEAIGAHFMPASPSDSTDAKQPKMKRIRNAAIVSEICEGSNDVDGY